MSSKKNENESARVRQLIRAKPRQCYLNAFRVIQQVREYAQADYVEGMVVVGGLAIEHGWVEKDGVIVDPTLPSEEMIYFPGLRFRGEPGLAKAIGIPKPEYTEEDLPFFYRFGWGGIDSPEFRAALVAAYRFAGCEQLAQQYERYTSKPTTENCPVRSACSPNPH
jgi:hypothetical protein